MSGRIISTNQLTLAHISGNTCKAAVCSAAAVNVAVRNTNPTGSNGAGNIPANHTRSFSVLQ